MGGLDLNKVFGAILATVLIIMGLQTLSSIVFSEGGHHGAHDEELACADKLKKEYAYFTEAACAGAGGGAVVEEVYDLGLLLASADAAAGEKVFKGACTACHSIEQGGANGTGPNLYGVVGADKGVHAGFGYSSAMTSAEGDWSWENMDKWLEAPSKYIRGTSMAYNGVKRDSQRADLLAYLASYSPDAPPPPAPLPAADDVPAEGDATDATIEPGDMEDPATATGEITTQDAVDGEAPAVETGAAETESTPSLEGDLPEAAEIEGTVRDAIEDAMPAEPEALAEEMEDIAREAGETIEEAGEATTEE